MSRRVRCSQIGHKLKKVYRRGDIVVGDQYNNQNQFLVHCFNDLQHAEALPAPEVVRYSIRLIVKRG